jgi:hypothetical protein
MDNSKKVEKALSPEEMTIISNIESMLSELKSYSGGGMGDMGNNQEMAAQNPIMREDSEEKIGTTDEKEKAIDKDLTTTPSDSATASDDAEERIEETQTEITEEGVDEVAKQLAKVLRGIRPVSKSKPKTNPIIKTLSDMVKVQKSNQDELIELKEAFKGLAEGLGVIKQMEIAKSETNTNKSNPITSSENTKTIEFINSLQEIVNKSNKKEEINKKESGVRPWNANQKIIRKSLNNRQVLKGLLGVKE